MNYFIQASALFSLYVTYIFLLFFFLLYSGGYSQSTVPLSKIVQESRSLPNKKKSAKKNKLQLQKTSYNHFEVGPVFTDEEGLSFSIEGKSAIKLFSSLI